MIKIEILIEVKGILLHLFGLQITWKLNMGIIDLYIKIVKSLWSRKHLDWMLKGSKCYWIQKQIEPFCIRCWCKLQILV